MVLVLGHRGLRHHTTLDENSLPALDRAFRASNGIEIDVSLSRDGTPHVIHDSTLRWLPGLAARASYVLKDYLDKESARKLGGRKLSDLEDSEITDMRLRKSGKIPRLAAVFALAAQHPGKIINIELKSPNSADAVLKDIAAAVQRGFITPQQIIVTSFDHNAIAEIRKTGPRIKCGLIFTGVANSGTPLYPWIKNNTAKARALTAHSLTSADAITVKPDYIVLPADAFTAAAARLIARHQPQARVMLWTSLEPKPRQNAQIARCLTDADCGRLIEAVITDYPSQMGGFLKNHGYRPKP